jgi:predicted nucleic acid-binding protein
MNSQIIPLTSHKFTSSDQFLIDANIWFYVNGPVGNPKHQRATDYSAAIKSMVKAGSRIHIDAIILSEFVNAYARFEMHRSSKYHDSGFKAYRRSEEFPRVARDIAIACRGILKIVGRRIDTQLSNAPLEQMLRDFETGRFDFNDQILLDSCKRNGLILVTHDIDCKDYDIAVLTANARLHGRTH